MRCVESKSKSMMSISVSVSTNSVYHATSVYRANVYTSVYIVIEICRAEHPRTASGFPWAHP